MPVTARLSKLFYDRLGEEIAQELVDWFNSVDATYRANLRELNEFNFARFDAKLEQRVATLDAKFGERLAELRAQLREEVRDLIKAGLVPFEARLTAVETRMTALEGRMTALATQMTAFQVDLEGRTQSLRTEIERSKFSLIVWMFGFWAPTALAMIGLFLKG